MPGTILPMTPSKAKESCLRSSSYSGRQILGRDIMTTHDTGFCCNLSV